MKKESVTYKTEIGLRNTKIVNGKEVFVDWRGKPTGEEDYEER